MYVQQALTFITGNLVEPAAIKKVKKDSITVSEIHVGVNGAGNEEASFVRISFFGEDIAEILRKAEKGSLITALGRLKQDRWESNGKKLSRLSVLGTVVRIYPERKVEDAPELINETADIIAQDAALAEVEQ